MEWNRLLQISLELWGALFCLICAFVVWAVQNKKADSNIVRMEMMVCILLIMDSLAWIFRGYPGEAGFWMVRISNFCVFVLNYSVMMEYSRYIVCTIEEQKDGGDFPVNTWMWAIYMLGLTGIALVCVNQFTGLFYNFDASNTYYRTENYYVLMILAYVASAIDMTFLIINAKCFSRKWFWSLLSYLILPTAAGVFQLFHYGISLINVSMALSLLLIFFVWLIDKSEKQLQQENELLEQKAKMAEQEKKIVSMQQDIMLSQIQPHFLYNSLTAIAQLCEKDAMRAKKATISFANYLRGNMDSLKSRELIPFSKELEHIESYLCLEQIRFGEKLEVIYDIETVEFRVPVLSVQPVVENAVKHGIKRHGTVVIRTQEQAEYYEIQVIDDGVGFGTDAQKKDAGKADDRSHIGIDNVRSRLQEMCGGQIHIASVPGEGTTVTIQIPKFCQKKAEFV